MCHVVVSTINLPWGWTLAAINRQKTLTALVAANIAAIPRHYDTISFDVFKFRHDKKKMKICFHKNMSSNHLTRDCDYPFGPT